MLLSRSLLAELAYVTSDNGVTVNDGTVGNISTKASVNLYGGSITSVKAENEASNVLVDGATVGEIKDADTLTVNSGKVTGAVSADSVILNPANDEEPVSVGAVSAHSLTVDGTVAAAAAGAFKMTSAGTITLIGKNASVSGIDFDYRNGRLVFQNFVGTVPAPTKAPSPGMIRLVLTSTPLMMRMRMLPSYCFRQPAYL